MGKNKVFTVILVTVFLLIGYTDTATDYYIALDGDDLNNSGTVSSPWNTIAHAIPYLEPGDTHYTPEMVFTMKMEIPAPHTGIRLITLEEQSQTQ